MELITKKWCRWYLACLNNIELFFSKHLQIFFFLIMLGGSLDHVFLENWHICVCQHHQYKKWAIFSQEIYPTLKIMHLNMRGVRQTYILAEKYFTAKWSQSMYRQLFHAILPIQSVVYLEYRKLNQNIWQKAWDISHTTYNFSLQ